jgi:hypothetical protein
MSNTIKSLICLCFVFCYQLSAAQTTVQEPTFTGGKLNHPSEIIQINYKPDRQELFKLCLSSVTFVKFTVGADGKVHDIAVSKDTPAAIAGPLKAAVLATNGHWTPKLVDGKPVKSDPYVMPLVFSYQLDCQNPREYELSRQDTQGMLNMLHFDDGEALSMLKCTLLPPARTALYR